MVNVATYCEEIRDGVDRLNNLFQDHRSTGNVQCQVYLDYLVDKPFETIEYVTSKLTDDFTVGMERHSFVKENATYKCGCFDLSKGIFSKRDTYNKDDDKQLLVKTSLANAIKSSIKNEIPKIINDPDFVLNKYKSANLPKDVFPNLSIRVVGYIPYTDYNIFKKTSEINVFPIQKHLRVDIIPEKKHAYPWELDVDDFIVHMDDWNSDNTFIIQEK